MNFMGKGLGNSKSLKWEKAVRQFLRPAEGMPNQRNHKGNFDNWFNSPAMQVMLAKKGIQSVGTLQINQRKNLSFDLRNPQRGAYIVKTTTIDNHQLYATQCSKNSESREKLFEENKRGGPKRFYLSEKSNLMALVIYSQLQKKGLGASILLAMLGQPQCAKSAMFTSASPKKLVFENFNGINLYSIDIKFRLFLNIRRFFVYLLYN